MIKNKKGFTLVELVIVIVIVGILSVVSVPVYRGYVDKAIMTEGKVLVGAIAKAELAYHVENGYFADTDGETGKVSAIDIDARGNKYFRVFSIQSGYSHTTSDGEDVDYLSISVYGRKDSQRWLLYSAQYSDGYMEDIWEYNY